MPVEIRIVPTKRQWDFITCPADIILFGGARGGAKTVGSLLDFWYHAIEHGPNALGLMVRRQRTDLKDTQLAAMNIYGNAADWKEHGSYFQFANGARLWFAYLESEKDAMAYQGFSLTRVYIEEVGQFPSLDPMWKLMATLRSAAGVKCQMRMTANPGGPSHFALKSYFVDNGPDRIVRDPDTGLTRCFIPSKIIDNPHLLAADPNYINRLRAPAVPSCSACGSRATGMPGSKGSSSPNGAGRNTSSSRSKSRRTGPASAVATGAARGRSRSIGRRSSRTPSRMMAKPCRAGR